MAKRKVERGNNPPTFDFLKNDPRAARQMASPDYHKESIMRNWELFATYWWASYQELGPCVIGVDFMSMVEDDLLEDDVQFALSAVPADMAREMIGHGGLDKMIEENDPERKMVLVFFHPKGQSFYHMGTMDARFSMPIIHDQNIHRLSEFAPSEKEVAKWEAKLEQIRKEET